MSNRAKVDLALAAGLIIGALYGWYWAVTDFQNPHCWQ